MKLKKLLLGAVLTTALAAPARAATYYIAPNGNDSNTGTTATSPWLTPKHSLACGDTVLASPGIYDETHFRPGNWGQVSCPSNNNVAWLKCSQFDTCKINISVAAHDAMTITASYWGVQGWEVHTSEPKTNQCFSAYPPDGVHSIHHVIFANNVANGCGDGGITTGSSNHLVGVDYFAAVGNAVYNASQDNDQCYSGIDVVSPAATDTLAGTHIYIAGNYSWHNIDPAVCGPYGVPTDGQGIMFDYLDENAYGQQIVVENNLSMFNGGTGFQTYHNYYSNPNAYLLVRNNTLVNDETGRISADPCAELNISMSLNTTAVGNLIQTSGATGCFVRGASVGLYTMATYAADKTDLAYGNWAYSAAGNNTKTVEAASTFAWWSNVFNWAPALAHPVEPPAPNCSGYASVPACMAQTIANFRPTNVSAALYGRQPVGAKAYDPMFPQWLCTVGLPDGLLTKGCH